MSDGEAFLQAILHEPGDDALRLIYADWLEERGQPRAEFIRVQVELDRMIAAGVHNEDPRRRKLFRREVDLIRTYKEEWFGPLRKVFDYWDCHGGFLDRVSTGAKELLQHADELFGQHPVRRLDLSITPETMADLAACAYLSRVEDLRLISRGGTSFTGWSEAGLRALATSPSLTAGLTELTLNSASVGDDGVRGLAAAMSFPRLHTLDLSGCDIHNKGAALLAGCAALAGLTTLNLSSNHIGNAGAQALAQSPHLHRLQHLNLHRNPFAKVGQDALRSRFGPRVFFDVQSA